MERVYVQIEPGSDSQYYWRDIWQYRGLLLFLAWRDVMVRYKQTTIGILWVLLRPLITLGAMYAIGWLFGSNVPEGVPRILMVAAATLPWQFFASAFGESANSLIANSNLLTKVYFPRLILPLSTILVSLIDLFALVGALGAGLFIAALNVKYRDFRYVVPVIIQFGLYITPVAFSSSDIYGNPNIPAAIKTLYACNPMVAVIDGFRYSLFGGSMVINWPGFIISTAVSLIMVVLGVWYFRRTEKGFADVI